MAEINYFAWSYIYNISTYKVCKDMIKAQDMFDDHVGGQSEFA